MSEWEAITIGSLGRVITGRTPSSRNPEHFGDEMPFLTPSDMNGARKIIQPARRLSKEGANVLKKIIIPKGIGVSCIGWQMGKSILIDEPSVTNQQINSIIVDESKVAHLFLYYALVNKRKELFRLGSGGSRTPILKKSDFERVNVSMPPRSTQDAIAYLLGSLDDKIELNRKMNHTLEAMAAALFKSWFVDFDPVVAKAEGRKPYGMNAETAELFPDRFQDSEIGPIPKGWQAGRMSDFLTQSRAALSPSEFPEEVFNHYSIPAFDAGEISAQECGKAIKSNKWLVLLGAVLVSKLNPEIPRVWWPSVDDSARAICSTEFIVALPKRGVSTEYVYSLLKSADFLDEFATFVTGTSNSHQRVKPEDFMRMKVILPSCQCLESFHHAVALLLKEARQAKMESVTLVTLRDTLLPKLLSGELRVKQAEKLLKTA